jgi:hypothetical protein
MYPRLKKIPTLFERDFENNPRYVTRAVTPGCEWVMSGEGVPTRKYDGTCVMFDGEQWWARREVKRGAATPPNFQMVERDDTTGKTVGWEPANQSGFAKWIAEAALGLAWQPGTYELCGPKVNGNPERFDEHRLIAHAAEVIEQAPRDYDGLAAWLRAHSFEGIVFHHPDGRMVKIKARDFAASQSTGERPWHDGMLGNAIFG